MTKRFNVTANEENWLEITDDEVNLNQLQVCDLLNELSEENEQLKSELDFLKDENTHMRDLVNENKELKQQVTHLTMYKNLFREFQKQLDGIKKKSDLDHTDFEDLLELTKGHVFDDEHGWIWLPVNDR